LELFPEHDNLVNPLVHRCQSLEAQVQQLQQQIKAQNDKP
ncbi:unnamed protein product, partial [marine sediment metagenome]